MFFLNALAIQAASKVEPSWHKTWPFGPGLEEGFFSVILKGIFILAILGGMAWLLRYLFGPGGPLRDKEFDEPDPEDPANQDKDRREQ
ncbi:MAG: hypothetical protein AB7D37_20820 [Desulfovibrio sp.]|uniref:hypothetical protein n=1 Tax=Solidesulfovibrio sp. C21 TaxID=3398613 RepID=UPI0039FC8C2B